MICKFFVTGGNEDIQLTERACGGHVTEQKTQKNGKPSHFVTEILGSNSVLRTWLGPGQGI